MAQITISSLYWLYLPLLYSTFYPQVPADVMFLLYEDPLWDVQNMQNSRSVFKEKEKIPNGYLSN